MVLGKILGIFTGALAVPIGLVLVLLCAPALLFFSQNPVPVQDTLDGFGVHEGNPLYDHAGFLLKAKGFLAFFIGFLFLSKPLTGFWGLFTWIPLIGIPFKILQKAIGLAAFVVALVLAAVLTFGISTAFSFLGGLF